MRGDGLRLAAAALLLVFSLPWEAADLGLYIPGSVFMSSQHPDGSPLAAVHHGHHHGMDGTLCVLAVLLLSRALRPGRSDGRRRAHHNRASLRCSAGATSPKYP